MEPARLDGRVGGRRSRMPHRLHMAGVTRTVLSGIAAVALSPGHAAPILIFPWPHIWSLQGPAGVAGAPQRVPAVHGRAHKLKIPPRRLPRVHAELAQALADKELCKGLPPGPTVVSNVHCNPTPALLAGALPVVLIGYQGHGQAGVQVGRQARGQGNQQRGGNPRQAGIGDKVSSHCVKC